jgi:anti-anti-sigma factor
MSLDPVEVPGSLIFRQRLRRGCGTTSALVVRDRELSMSLLQSYHLDKTLVFELHGEHDLSTMPRIEALVNAASEGQPRVIFDLSEARYLDSTVLAFLLRRWKALGNRMSVVIPPLSPIRRIFAVTQLDHYLPIVETLSEANASYGSAATVTAA